MAAHYTCEITFHRAEHVPIGDLNNFSCDPYILATLQLPTDHTPLVFRTHTVRRTLSPTFDERWIVAGIPSEGFTLTLRLRDEDPGNHDDRLGKVDVRFPSAAGQRLAPGWDSGATELKVEKKRGSMRAHAATYLVSMITRGAVSHRARIWLSARVVAESRDGRVATVGPPRYTQHFSPLIGRLVSGGTAAKTGLSTSTFVANRLQLAGPPPRSLRHRYVGYAPFIKSMFKKSGIRGKILNRGLHHQYYTVYSYDKSTVYGVVGEGQFDTDGSTRHAKEKAQEENAPQEEKAQEEKAQAEKAPEEEKAHEGGAPEANGSAHPAVPPPGDALAREFLRMTSHGSAGRLFTYVITLDSEWRFTETGAEFGVDLLSKHSMHANVAREIAFSGEFFVRRIALAGEDEDGKENKEESSKIAEGKVAEGKEAESEEGEHKEAKNGSGEGESKETESREAKGREGESEATEHNDTNNRFCKCAKCKKKKANRKEKGADDDTVDDPAAYEIVIDNDSGTYRPRKELLPTLQAWLARPENLGALGRVTAMDGFDETLKRWKEERVEEKRRAKKGETGKMAMAPRRGSSVSSISSARIGGSSVSSSDVEAALAEDAKRARENDDKPDSLREDG